MTALTSHARIALLIVILAIGTRCGSRHKETTQSPPEPPPPEASPGQASNLSPEEQNEAEARAIVKEFLGHVRQERYEEAYESASYIMKKSYTYDQFLMVAGKLEMEELDCITDEDIDAMEPTSGHVGLGPKDIVVEGFLVRYSCEDGPDRLLIIYLDWGRSIAPPGGVASMYWK